jgi:hypothetical protein
MTSDGRLTSDPSPDLFGEPSRTAWARFSVSEIRIIFLLSISLDCFVASLLAMTNLSRHCEARRAEPPG